MEDAAETLREAASLGVNVARLWRTLGHCLYEMDKVINLQHLHWR